MTPFYTLIQQRQFYWWLGHVCVFFNGLVYFSSVLSFHPNTACYKRAYLGALVSYAIVIYNSIGVTHTSLNRTFLSDENVHYFVIAFYWFSCPPMTVTLIPFFIFSLFHTLAFIRTHLFHTYIPTCSLVSQLDSNIKYFIDHQHKHAMYYVAYIEVVVIMTRIALGVIIWHTSVLALIVFTHFIRLRYCLSSYTQEAVHTAVFYLDDLLLARNNPSPTVISHIYSSIKRLVVRYAHIQ
ncbi:uncharacterized protein B0P05DRAFT_535858 [Gilbertella persicaria]|uniref:uncharacterized protein n=1 Tax=Gilbertella persicaria TaxID=101096 RepID=UPI00221EC72B|nr:uncharacterized protein B0P05DRAFT_535858 [Gilbertella persicaria]KAI8084018.1 hypothetical protein B0P05DRAFT_535858 [Gilbertella persicaria]